MVNKYKRIKKLKKSSGQLGPGIVDSSVDWLKLSS